MRVIMYAHALPKHSFSAAQVLPMHCSHTAHMLLDGRINQVRIYRVRSTISPEEHSGPTTFYHVVNDERIPPLESTHRPMSTFEITHHITSEAFAVDLPQQQALP